jgi:hypothetical protein
MIATIEKQMSLSDNNHTHASARRDTLTHTIQNKFCYRYARPLNIYNNNFIHAIATTKWQIPAMSMWIDMFSSFNSHNNTCVHLFVWPFTGIVWRLSSLTESEKKIDTFFKKRKVDPPSPFSKTWIRPWVHIV